LGLIKQNRYKIGIVFAIYSFALLAIGLVNFPYLDDVGRQLWGYSKFAEGYSRWGSEILAWIYQGSRHLTDTGLLSPLVTAVILTAASVIVVFVINKKQPPVSAFVVSTLLGLNPWFLQNISFRFDSPYMAFSVLFSVIPFLWWSSKTAHFFLLSCVGIFLMCNTYQASSGIYIVLVLALSFKELLANGSLVAVIKKTGLAASAYICAMIVYLLETKLNPDIASRGGNVAIAALKDIPAVFISNSQMYLQRIAEQSTRIWLLLFVLIVLLFCIVSILAASTNKWKGLLYAFLYLVLGAILSYGVFLIFPEKLALAAPRYAYGFSVFAVITCLLVLSLLPNIFSLAFSAKGLLYLFSFYLLSFPFVYAASLAYQRDSFERQSMLLADDLKNFVSSKEQQVYATTLFKDSPIVENTARNYPILKDLVPANSALFWPNQVLFKTYSGIDIDIQPFNSAEFDKSRSTLKSTDYYYDIYQKEKALYIIAK
jgi:hypothetical protein